MVDYSSQSVVAGVIYRDVRKWLADRFEGLEDDAATRRLVAAAVCAEQVLDLIDHGVEDLHFHQPQDQSLADSLVVLPLVPLDHHLKKGAYLENLAAAIQVCQLPAPQEVAVEVWPELAVLAVLP